jgi:hypothetical protein
VARIGTDLSQPNAAACPGPDRGVIKCGITLLPSIVISAVARRTHRRASSEGVVGLAGRNQGYDLAAAVAALSGASLMCRDLRPSRAITLHAVQPLGIRR